MVTYDFYKNTYLGSALSEAAFPAAIARAEDWLKKLERCYQVEASGEDSRALALCAVAETMAEFRKRQFVSQATVGGVSVRYEEDDGKLQRQLYQDAGVFLDIKRGVR